MVLVAHQQCEMGRLGGRETGRWGDWEISRLGDVEIESSVIDVRRPTVDREFVRIGVWA